MSNRVTEVIHCFHGYQPWRTNEEGDLIKDPFNGGAKDYTKIATDECYTPCAEAELLSLTTFDISPQTLNYLLTKERATYDRVIKNDEISKINFNGYGGAIMQGLYYHLIAPFEREEVIDTQVYWSKVAFKEHFGRDPEGAWLPEAAVDHRTLEILGKHGIKFTVLAPWQASRIKKIGTSQWEETWGGIDPSRPYKYNLSGGKSIAIFFFDDQLGEKIAHNKEGIHSSPFVFHEHVKRTRESGLTLTYNDLETIEHHHKGIARTFLEALHGLYEGKPQRGDVAYKLTNLAKYLAEHPPEYEVEIIPWTSWSCSNKDNGKVNHHYLGRWGDPYQKDCCKCGDVISSDWRANLRTAHTDLNREIEKLYFDQIGPVYFRDPKKALKEYIFVILGKENIFEFLRRHTKDEVLTSEYEKAHDLLKMMNYSMLMNTSCGWFHEKLLRIEPIINMHSANSALESMYRVTGNGYEIAGRFLDSMSRVQTLGVEQGGRKISNGKEAFEIAVQADSSRRGRPILIGH